MNSRLPIGLLMWTVLVAVSIAQTDLPLRSVHIRSVADHTSRPRFDLPLRYRIVEELPVGTAIADLVVDAGLKRKYGPEVLDELEYRLLQDPAPVAIAVGLRTGVLTTVGRVDRDELVTCRDKITCELTIDITVRPARYFQVIKVTIEIQDINDNEPRFRDHQFVPGMTSSPSAVIVRVRESASPGTSFALPVAVDTDSPESSVRTYELIETNSPNVYGSSLDSSSLENEARTFSLDIITRPHDQLEPRLVVRLPLDRERRSEHRFTLVAYDGGRPPKSGSVDIEVQVLDSNDNTPVFNVPQTGYEANVTENVVVGTSIIRVQAIDADEGPNAEVVYRFSAHTSSAYGNLFAIDNRTGKISVIGPLDRERFSVYQLTVIAQDLGPDSMPVDAAVVIRVIDVNDNAPVIAVNTLQRNLAPPGVGTSEHNPQLDDVTAAVTAIAEVQENLAVGAFVGHMSVSDEDSGDFGRVECNMTEMAAFSLVRRGRSSTEYQIVTAQSFDRELRDRYDSVITCSDGGYPPLTSTVLMTVRITDSNDNRPQFGQPSYSTRVAENLPPGTVVLRLSAADLDIGVNADIHYALSTSSSADGKLTGKGAVGSHESPFRIDPDEGIITVSGSGLQSSIDREQYSSFSFAVLAIDHGVGLSQTGSTVVVVTIDDVNDEFPVFSTNRYVFDVDENRPETEIVGTVFASDGDATRPNNIVTYRLQFDVISVQTRSDDSEKCFTIDAETGVIRTTKILDRELNDAYHFSIIAADRGRPSLSATAQVIVRVLDVNDNDPVFGLGDDRRRFDENSVVVVSSSAPTGSYVTSVTAFDVDDAENGRIRYQIVAQRVRRQLEADEVSGHVTSSDQVDANERFAIDPDSGDVVIVGSFPELDVDVDDIEVIEFTLTVRATDCGFPVRSAEMEFRIIVNASVPYHAVTNGNGAFPSARWKPEASQDHVTIVAWVGAASALATIILLILIVAVVRMRSRRKSRLDRRRRSSSGDDFRDRLTEARLALTSNTPHSPTGSAAVSQRQHVAITECCDEVHGSTAEMTPLQQRTTVRFDTGSRCCSPFSQVPKTASMTTWSGNRQENMYATGNGGCDLRTSCGRDAVLIDCQKSMSTPMVQAVVVACAAAASENERDSQHSGGEASNADSGRGHSSCCGDESTDESVSACRLLHHHWQQGLGFGNGSTGTCCVAGPTSRMIHYLPPPPPPRMAAYCPSAAAAAAAAASASQHRGGGWSTLSGGMGFKSILTAHNEGIEYHASGTEKQLQQPSSTTETASTLSKVSQSPLWTASTAQQQIATIRSLAPHTVTSEPRRVTDNSSSSDGRPVTTSPQHTENGSSVVWHSNKNGVVV